MINNRYWAGVVTGFAPNGQISVLADCGVHRWYDRPYIWSLDYAQQFIAGRILGLEGHRAGMSVIGNRSGATILGRQIFTLEQDLITLRRG